MEGVGLAVFGPRVAGQVRRIELQAGRAAVEVDGVVVQPAQPPLLVEFLVPDAVQMAKAEARASEALHHIRRSSAHLATYGMSENGVTVDDIPALARIVTAIETALELWKDWNFAVLQLGEDGQPVSPPNPIKGKLDAATIGRVLEDTSIRSAWSAHLDAASPLERAEGNVSAASPNGSSAEAAKPAEAAPNS